MAEHADRGVAYFIRTGRAILVVISPMDLSFVCDKGQRQVPGDSRKCLLPNSHCGTHTHGHRTIPSSSLFVTGLSHRIGWLADSINQMTATSFQSSFAVTGGSGRLSDELSSLFPGTNARRCSVSLDLNTQIGAPRGTLTFCSKEVTWFSSHFFFQQHVELSSIM